MGTRSLTASLAALLPLTGTPAPASPELAWLGGAAAAVVRAHPNDNRRPAGALRDGILTLHLEARLAMWHPDGDDAPGAEVPAFGERGRVPEIPGPLIRVPAGTEVVLTITNEVPGDTLVVHGLHGRPLPAAAPSEPLRLPPGAARDVRFRLDAPGTYYYWATTMGRVFAHRTREDAQLSGAIVVDPPGVAAPADRILVIGLWADTAGVTRRPSTRSLFVVNGRSWPRTERLSYAVGDTVRWRVLNISADIHPMHLHGFYFRVDSQGDGRGDTTYAETGRKMVVTHFMPVGQTMRMSWVPERAGNWLFHCHIPQHFAPRGPLGLPREVSEPSPIRHEERHALDGMGGLVVGVTARLAGGRAEAAPESAGRRRLRLLVRQNAGGTAAAPFFGFALHEGGPEPVPTPGHRVGPAIVLERGRPVSIVVVNQTPEPTAVHWHGIELESYYDGVAGFSGTDARPAPAIMPADSFEARFTPPRAGTFIYHTHVDELRQQRAGLAGPLIVIEPGLVRDTVTDFAVLISSPSDSAAEARAVLVNGALAPAPLTFRTGVPHRLRFINITTARPGLRVELRRDAVLSEWRLLAKDGADLPPERRGPRPAVSPLSIGETLDVEVRSPAGELRLDILTSAGGRLATLPILIR